MTAGRIIFRTDLSVFIASATFLFIGLYFTLFGSSAAVPPFFGGSILPWRIFVLVLCGAGTLLPFIKDLGVRPVPRRVLGLSALALPYALALPVLRGPADPMIAAGATMVLLGGLHAFWRNESPELAPTRDLFIVALGALPVLALLLTVIRPVPLGLAVAPLAIAATLGIALAVMHLESPAHRHADLLRVIVGLSLLAVSIEGFIEGRYPTAIVGATFGATALLYPLFAQYRLAAPWLRDGIGAEAKVVAKFRAVDEVGARGGFIAICIALFFEPTIVTVPTLLYVMLFATVFAFTAVYRLGDPAKGRYKDIAITVYTNVLLLFVICHVTGGLASPFTWFLPFVAYGLSYAPHVQHVFGVVALIAAFYTFELFFARATGLPWVSLAVRHFVPEMLVNLSMCVFLYSSVRDRRQVDAELVQFNAALKEGLSRERELRKTALAQNKVIRLAKRRDEALFAALADAVFVLDADGRVSSVNLAASRLAGKPASALLGEELIAAVAVRREDEPSFSLKPTVDAAFSGAQSTLPDNIFLERAGGVRVWLGGYAVPFVPPGSTRAAGAVVTLRDITPLHDADRMKSDFLSVAAHQLRTPLTNVRWRLEMLTDSVAGKMEAEQRTFVDDAYSAVRKMVSLIGSILAVTRLESGRVPFAPVLVDLKTLTKETVDRVAHAAETRRLKITTDVPDLPPVMLDRALAFEVFANLVDNAVRYTPDGGSIAIAARDLGPRIVWTVTDTGIGIPEEQGDKLFRKFFRADNAVEHSSEGSGLGLYLARYIASSWGGDLTFVSEVGKGTTFTVTVPKEGMKAKGGSISLRA